MRRQYVALFAFVLALAVVNALVAFWAPVQGDDWNHWIWAGQHRDQEGADWLVTFATAHVTFSDVVGYVLARARFVHVIVTPAVIIALIVGMFVIATRRLPRPSWEDLLGLALVSALLWIAQPSAAVTLFHTPHVALYVYGAAVAVWFIAPLRCGWHVPRALWPVLALAGYCVGTSSRAIATATLFGVIVILRARPRDQRAHWMWIALGALVVGVLVGYAAPPWIEFGRVVRRGFEHNLVGQGLLRFAVQELGELVALVAALALADLVLGALDRPRAPPDARPDPSETLRWLVAAGATTVWCLFGPRYNEATLLPVTCMLVIAALPYLLWLAKSRVLRYPIIGIAIGVHTIVWPIALATYHRFGEEAFARLAAIESTPPGELAIVRPYSQVPASFWFFGEDLGKARQRQLLAIEAFGIRDIKLDPPFRRLEQSPGIEVTLEIDGPSAAELAAAKSPTIWATEVSAARKQFELLLKRLRAVTDKPVDARLVVTNVSFSDQSNRPLLAAWSDRTGTMIPRIARSPLDEHSQHTIRIYGQYARSFTEAWIVDDGKARSTPYRRGSPQVQPLTTALHTIIVCSPERCLVADAFVPTF